MIRLLLGGFIAALCLSSCVFDEEKKADKVAFQLDPVLVGLHVEIFRLDAQGLPIAPAIFKDILHSLSDVADLDARGYGGGPAVFSIKGFKGVELVYEIKVTFSGASTVSVQDIKLIPLYTVNLKIADPVDLDKDGYQSAYRLVTDVNTNQAVDSILLKYYWRKEGATEWESRGGGTRFRISKSASDDTVSESMVGGLRANGTAKVEAYNQQNVLVAEKTLNLREETGDQDDPGFHLQLINHTGAFLDAKVTVAGQEIAKALAPTDTLSVERTVRPTSFSYYATSNSEVVVWDKTFTLLDQASYEVTLTLENNTEEFFVLFAKNNSTTVVDRIVFDQGLATETTVLGPIPGDGEFYNVGVFDYSKTASVSFFNDSSGRVATIQSLQYEINEPYGFRFSDVILSSSNWADPALNLYNKKWKLIGSWVEPGLVDSTGASTNDLYAGMLSCDRDGFTTFASNGVLTDDEGPTKCEEISPQTTKGTWTLNTSRTRLTMTWQNGSAPVEYKVEAMTPTILRLSTDKRSWSDGKVHNLTLTLSSN